MAVSIAGGLGDSATGQRLAQMGDWSLKRRKLLGEFAIHVDQLSFALALRELGLSADLLPIEWNYPIHLPAAQLPDVTPQIIHFHRQSGVA